MHFWKKLLQTLHTITLGFCSGVFSAILMIASWDTGLAILRRQEIDDGRVALFVLMLIIFFHVMAITKDASKFATSALVKLFETKMFLWSAALSALATIYAWMFQWV